MEILDTFPVWLLLISMVIMSSAAAEVGFRIGIRLQDRGANPGPGNGANWNACAATLRARRLRSSACPRTPAEGWFTVTASRSGTVQPT